jgi:general secretion pathway protein M
MRQWFAQFNQREQISLVLLGIALIIYLLYKVAWSPLAEKREAMLQQNQGVAASLQRVDGMVSEIVKLRQQGASSGSGRNLTALVNQSTRALSLQVNRLQPNSRGEIQVRMEAVSFDNLMTWLHDMEYKEGLLLREVSIAESGAVGRVNATIRIAQGV